MNSHASGAKRARLVVIVCAISFATCLGLLFHFSRRPLVKTRDSATLIADAATQATTQIEPELRARLSESYGKLPLRFEENRGQTDRRVKFVARGRGYGLFLTADEAVLSLRRTDRARAARNGVNDEAANETYS
jgi:hypothetical protein